MDDRRRWIVRFGIALGVYLTWVAILAGLAATSGAPPRRQGPAAVTMP